MTTQGHNSGTKSETVRRLIASARKNADYIEEGICPSCGSILEVVYDGSSGSEMWCPERGCCVSLKMDVHGDFSWASSAPKGWTGEDA